MHFYKKIHFIYLRGGVAEREKERQYFILRLMLQIAKMAISLLDFTKEPTVSSRSPIQAAGAGGSAHHVGMSYAVFPDALAGNWIRMGVARTSTGVHVGCWPCRQESYYSTRLTSSFDSSVYFMI